jgi:hypothetical protein
VLQSSIALKNRSSMLLVSSRSTYLQAPARNLIMSQQGVLLELAWGCPGQAGSAVLNPPLNNGVAVCIDLSHP